MGPVYGGGGSWWGKEGQTHFCPFSRISASPENLAERGGRGVGGLVHLFCPLGRNCRLFNSSIGVGVHEL